MSETKPAQRKRLATFFRKFYQPAEVTLLRRINHQSASLAGEIDLLRVSLRRMSLAFTRIEDPSPEEHRNFVNAVGQACLRLERLITTEVRLSALDDDLKEMLNQSLRLLAQEWTHSAQRESGAEKDEAEL